MIIDILIVIAAIIVALVILIVTRPDDFRVTRAATVYAPAKAAFAWVNGLHQWEVWSPWAKLDPEAKTVSWARPWA